MGHRILELQKISKNFPGVKALDKVDFDLDEGEVHCIVGENGAGKSTLIKILAGLYPPDEGDIYIDGKRVIFSSVSDSRNAGIEVLHQDLNLFKDLTVSENVSILSGVYPKNRLGMINWKEIKNIFKDILAQLKIEIKISPDDVISDLSFSHQKIVTLACMYGAYIIRNIKRIGENMIKVFIFDEPTSSLSEKEVNAVFNFIEEMKNNRVAIIYITHRFEEIYKISDRVTVLRDGKKIGCCLTEEIKEEDLIKMIAGRPLKLFYEKAKIKTGENVLEVENISKAGEYSNISFDLKKSQILGFAGLVGSGRSEIAKTLFGITEPEKGKIVLNNKKVRFRSVRDAIKSGILYIPEDKHTKGLFLEEDIVFNITLPFINKFSYCGIVSEKKQIEYSENFILCMGIKTPSVRIPVMYLSGGNQQKVVLSKWISGEPSVIIFDEPTQGIDVSAKMDIYRLISSLVKQGISIILISSDLQEVFALSDRIIVIRYGKKVAEFDTEKTSQTEVMKYMLGAI